MSSIAELVARLDDALDALDWTGRRIQPRFRPPATPVEIEALEESMGRALPPSYREFLEIHNGMEGLEQYDWGVAGCTDVTRGDSFDDVRSGHLYVYKDADAAHPAVKDLKSKTHLVGSDFDYEIAYFDLDTFGDEEPQIRRLSMDKGYTHYKNLGSFKDFLGYIVEVYEDMVALEEESLEGFDQIEQLAGQDQLLKELAALLGGADAEEEPEPEPQLSPEMEKASKLVRTMMNKLIEAELMELVEGPGMTDALEDYLLKKLLRSTSQKETTEKWIKALSKAREVEELYGTDEELVAVMNAAFEQIAAES